MIRSPSFPAACALRPAAPAAALLALALLLPTAAGAAGPIAFGGWYTEGGDALVGAGVRLGLGPFAVVPNGEYIFVDGGTRYTLNLDAHWSLVPLPVAGLWVGGGLGRHVSDPDGADDRSESVINLLAGVGLDAVPLKPFAQAKYVLMDGDDPVALTFGIRF